MNEREIFAEALKHSGTIARATFLDAACGAEPAMRHRIERLLSLHDRDDSLLERRPAELLHELKGPAAEGDETPSLSSVTAVLLSFLGPAQRADSLGRLAHYEVLEVLGQGGCGIVFRAMDEKLQRVVAIKMLAPHLAMTSSPRKRFIREARAAAQVRHEHVVQIYAVEEQPIPYLVMEFIDGQTLQQRLDAHGPLDALEVIRLGQQIAHGLAAAHDKGLIHRDIKPANILLESGPDPRIKLTDFGLARTNDDANMTTSGFVAGTPMYMAPEQARGDQLDHRADLFSFGSVLYTMCCGRPPFRAPNTLAVLKRVAEDTPRAIRDVIPEVPQGLCAIVHRLHLKDPKDRFASAKEVAQALADCLKAPTPAVPPTLGGLPRPAWIAAAALVLAVGGWFGWSAYRGTQPDDGDVKHRIAMNEPPTPDADSGSPKKVDGQVPTPVDPVDSWAKGVAFMPADDQVTAVLAKLKQLNPGFEATKVSHRTDNDVVVELRLNNCEHLNNLAPIRALSGLKALFLKGKGAADIGPLKGMQLTTFDTMGPPIKDLAPLTGMPLKNCNIWGFQTDDLSPLAGMQLEGVNVGASPVKDISVFRSMRIVGLCLNHTQIEDLSPLEGHPLISLECQNTRVTDIRPLAKSPLQRLWLRGSPIADYSTLGRLPVKDITLDYQPELHAKLLRSITTLERINGLPKSEFLGNDGQ